MGGLCVSPLPLFLPYLSLLLSSAFPLPSPLPLSSLISPLLLLLFFLSLSLFYPLTLLSKIFWFTLGLFVFVFLRQVDLELVIQPAPASQMLDPLVRTTASGIKLIPEWCEEQGSCQNCSVLLEIVLMSPSTRAYSDLLLSCLLIWSCAQT